MAHPADRTDDILERFRRNWPDADNDVMHVALLTQRLARLIQEHSRGLLAEMGLTLTEFEVLCALRTAPPPHVMTPSGLYDAVLLSSGGTTKVLKALEGRGLIDRPDGAGDRRSHPVRLTGPGRVLAEQAMARVQFADASFLGIGSGGGEVRRLARGLAGLVRTAESQRKP